MDKNTIVDILKRARKVLVGNAWCKYRFVVARPGGKAAYCALGAVRAVTGGETVGLKFLDKASARISKKFFGRKLDTVTFNDARKTQKTHMVAVFDSAIRAAKRAR